MNHYSLLLNKLLGAAGLQIVGRGLSVISGVILARYLGVEQFGLYSFVLSIITIASIPVIAGFPSLLVREIATAELDKRWGELKGLLNWSTIFIVTVSLMMMIVLCTVLYTNWINKVTANLLWFALFLIPLKGLLTKQSSVLNGFRKPILALLPEIILIPLLSLLFYLLLIVLDIEFTGVLIIKIQLAVSLLVLIFCLLFITKNMSTPFKKMKPIYHFSKWHRALLPFSIMTFVATVNIELASALLGFIDDKESVGYFKVAMQGVGLITLGITVVNSVIGPNIARLYKSNDFQATQLLLTQSVKLSCACSLPIAIILMFFGDFIIILLFGEEYVAATKVLFILCVGQIVNICMGSVGLVLNMTGNEKHSLKSLMKALMLNLVLLIILVPIYQEIGAAIAVSISLICWNVLMAIDVYKITKLKTWISINNDNNKIKEFD